MNINTVIGLEGKASSLNSYYDQLSHMFAKYLTAYFTYVMGYPDNVLCQYCPGYRHYERDHGNMHFINLLLVEKDVTSEITRNSASCGMNGGNENSVNNFERIQVVPAVTSLHNHHLSVGKPQ